MASAIASAASATAPSADLTRAHLRATGAAHERSPRVSSLGSIEFGRSGDFQRGSGSRKNLSRSSSGLSARRQRHSQRRCVAAAAAADSTGVEWDDQGPSDVNPTDLSESEEERGREGGWRGGRSEEEKAQSDSRQKIFNNIAPMYDNLNDWLSLGQHRVWKRMTVGWSRARPGDSVLDICCGSGDLSFLLAEKVGPTGRVTGLDFAAQQLVVAAQKQQESYSARRVDMRWIEGDALDLPFPAATFDAVTMGYGLRNVTSIRRALEEIRRVLKDGSSAAILDFNHTEDPLVAAFQEFALQGAVVPVARLFGLSEEYEYLLPSIRRFPTGRQQEQLGRDAGFSKAVHYEIGGGLMGVLVLQK
ncbi:hypothetical protein CLOP_g24009 [Closterium sp. NIES-67]|nr:hypothetical protein CLOP_g24009 [Closterium sp. NIES-67]